MGADEDEFVALYEREHDAVQRYVQRRTEPPDVADVVAEVFLLAWRKRRSLPDPVLPWLLATARRVLANQRRGLRRRTDLWLRVRDHATLDAPAVSQQIESQTRWKTALGSLRRDDQEALALIAWDGLSYDDAAASLSVSRSAFAMRLTRARQRLEAALADYDRDESPVQPKGTSA